MSCIPTKNLYIDETNLLLKVRVDAAGNCDYRQFEAVPHPPLKPMAYAQSGMASMFM